MSMLTELQPLPALSDGVVSLNPTTSRTITGERSFTTAGSRVWPFLKGGMHADLFHKSSTACIPPLSGQSVIPLPLVPLEPSQDCPDKRLSVSDGAQEDLGSLKGDPNGSWCSALSGQACFIRAMGYLGRVSTRDGSRAQLSPKCPLLGALKQSKTVMVP